MVWGSRALEGIFSLGFEDMDINKLEMIYDYSPTRCLLWSFILQGGQHISEAEGRGDMDLQVG